MSTHELRQEIISSPKIQAVVASSTITGGLTGLMGYLETGAALVALVAGAILAVFMAINGYQKIKQSSMENQKLKIELAAIERREKPIQVDDDRRGESS